MRLIYVAVMLMAFSIAGCSGPSEMPEAAKSDSRKNLENGLKSEKWPQPKAVTLDDLKADSEPDSKE